MHNRVSSWRGLRWLWVSVVVVLLDRLSKLMALKYLTPYVALPVFPSFNLTLAFNKGAAFSFLDTASGWQAWFFGVIAIGVTFGILIWLKRLSPEKRWLAISLTLIIGGALGNLWDRILYGHVIDFLQFYVAHFYWPVFNLADSAVCVGAFMLFFDAVFFRK